jgi:hypothetical protein
MERPQRPAAIEEALAKRRDILTLFIVGTGIAFAIGTLSSVLVASEIVSPWVLTLGATVLLAAGAWYLLRQVAAVLSFDDTLQGVVFVDSSVNEVVPVKDYRFSERLFRTLNAVKVESKSIYSQWEQNPLVEPRNVDDEPKTPSDKTGYYAVTRMFRPSGDAVKPASASLLEEAALFVVLEDFSYHMDEYFGRADEVHVRELKREDIPEFLLKNRVLNLLSTPIEQRDVFLNAFPDPENRPQGEIVAVIGSDGSNYSRFDLNLPTESRISHRGHNGFAVNTSRFELVVDVQYTGFHSVVSPSFSKNYLKANWESVVPLMITLRVYGRIKPLSLLRSRGWEYYRWLDSLRAKLETAFDFKAFQNSIHWDLIEPLLFSMIRQTESKIPRPKETGGQAEPGAPGRRESP